MAMFHADIKDANARFMQAVRTRDEEGFVALYTEDAILLLPGRAPLSGLPGVRTFFASFDARGVSEVQLTTLEIEACGDTAWERGSSQARGADGGIIGTGNYIVIWKQVDGGWKLHRDILNASS